MSPLRDLISDLIEKRLWPVALLLVGALVAVPLVLAKSPTVPQSATPAATTAPSSAVADAEPAVNVVAEPSGSAPLQGHTKDPFRQQHVPPKASTADGGGTPPVDSGGGTSTDGSSGGSPAKPQKTYAVVSVDVRFGKATGTKYKHDDVPRLSPIPGPAKPIVVFTGVRTDLKTAVFLLSSDVKAQGDGTCTPSRRECTTIEVKEGDVVLLDYTRADGRLVHYELDIDKVAVTRTTSKADAEAAYARVSHVGSRLVARRVRLSARNTAAGGQPYRIPYRYAAARGVLHIAPFLSRRVAPRSHTSGRVRTTRAAVPGRAGTP